jgi:two-component system chemotaxis response regulator CheB
MMYSVAGIGTSWGGLAALTKLLAALPADFSIPVVVVQHRSKESEHLLVQLLQDSTDLRVCEIEDKDPLVPGTVHVAPANYHVLVDRRNADVGRGHLWISGDWSSADRSE